MTVKKPKSETNPAETLIKEIIASGDREERIFSVSSYLELLNTGLKTFTAKIRGEVSSVKEQGGHCYFNLKDKEDGSTLSCIIWHHNYRLSGLALKEGMEISAFGHPDVYKVTGRLSFQAGTIELVGEGALKRQYEELKTKLSLEGLFSPDRKKTIPLFVEKIGLITSRQGEAIFDFQNNLGHFGLKIKHIDSRVEGAQAVASLIKAIQSLKTKDIDVLVLIRGGGSLESLQSFNNEMLVRELANFPKPVITGIGHDQDVSLADLVADKACSTPTGAAKFLSYAWEQAQSRTELANNQIRLRFTENLAGKKNELERLGRLLNKNFENILLWFKEIATRLRLEFSRLQAQTQTLNNLLNNFSGLVGQGRKMVQRTKDAIDNMEQTIKHLNPERLLELGYSLCYSQGKILRRVSQVSAGDEIEVQLSDGKISTEVKKHG